MIKAVENIVKYVGISLDEALRMATLYPARAIHVDHLLGSIEQGKIANLVTLSHDLTVLDTIVNGIITERKSPN